VQGHGAGPWGFTVGQRKLIDMKAGFGGGLKRAQSLVLQKRRWFDEQPPRTKRNMLEKATQLHDQEPFAPFFWDLTDSNNYGSGFDGVIEFRNEFRNRGLGAFWTRWRIPWDEYEFNNWRDSLEDPEIEWLEFYYDNPSVKSSGAGRDFAKIWQLPYVSNLSIDYANRKITLEGSNLNSEKVNGVYFVSHTRRRYGTHLKHEAKRGFDPYDEGESMLSTLGEWEESGVTRYILKEGSGLTFLNDRIDIHIPDSFHPPVNYWRPLLQTPVLLEIRSQWAFRWPNDNNQNVIGHGAFNIGYFPLFEKRGGQYRPVKVPFSKLMARHLLQFYERSSPEKTTRVIRPRKPIW
jgi:hypothetical protein